MMMSIIIDNPDLLHIDYKYIVRSWVFFWLKHELYNLADKGSNEICVNKITEIINSKTDSYSKRWENFKEIYHVKKFFENI